MFMALIHSHRFFLNMWTILALVIVVIPNIANAQEIINAAKAGEVLLPCRCPNKSETRGVYWQKNPDIPVLMHKNNTTTPRDGYKQRATIFLNENNDNCSLRLSNINSSDEGAYMCTFYSQDLPVHCEITLHVQVSDAISNPDPEESKQPVIAISLSVIGIVLLALVFLVVYRFLKSRRNMENRGQEVIY